MRMMAQQLVQPINPTVEEMPLMIIQQVVLMVLPVELTVVPVLIFPVVTLLELPIPLAPVILAVALPMQVVVALSVLSLSYQSFQTRIITLAAVIAVVADLIKMQVMTQQQLTAVTSKSTEVIKSMVVMPLMVATKLIPTTK